MTQTQAQQHALALISKSKTAVLATVDKQGFPNMRAMLNLEWEGLKTIWFSTNTSSKKIIQIAKNNKAGAYFFDEKMFQGLRLIGHIQVLQDKEAKRKLWRPGFEMYYPQGIDDPDYSVLEFTVSGGNYYENLEKTELVLL